MNRSVIQLVLAAGLVGLAACKENASPAAVIDEATVTADVAASAGDAMATAVAGMTGNETTVGMAAPALGLSGNNADFNRSRTCYDGTGAVVAGCTPLSSVRMVVTTATLNTTRSDTTTLLGGATIGFSGAVHRAWTDTLTRNFTSNTETSRTHSGLQTVHDTTSFSSDQISRVHEEAATDSIRGVTWNLPRLSNPFPVAGYIVRVDTVHVDWTGPNGSQTRDEVKTIKVTFPPIDAQGNVTLTINGTSCTLNLVTHRVSNCQ
jgi:hypothetical protein